MSGVSRATDAETAARARGHARASGARFSGEGNPYANFWLGVDLVFDILTASGLDL